jgi:transposase
LQRGDIVVLDKLPCHKAQVIQTLIAATGASLLFLPPYSPDFSPIEKAFSKLKAFLRRAQALTVDSLLEAIAQALDSVTALDALGWFSSCRFLNLDHAT